MPEATVNVRNMAFFLRCGFVSISLNPKLEDHPLSAVRDCLFNIFAVTLHTGGRSSVRNLRTCRAVVTGTHQVAGWALVNAEMNLQVS